ncbi:ph domain-containing protein [Sarocladium implicatum]|nr:ph domain-containing protein [Sarocladium implicatum]
MASFVARIVGKKILGETVKNKFGKEDPYFESVPATRIDGRPSGKVKKRRKALPPGISEHDGQILTKVKRRAYRLDLALFEVCGVRFGWGSAIGLIPAIGDALDAMLAMLVVKTCRKVEGGLPMGLLVKMLMNVAFDFVVGLIPFAGDLLDAMFRANTRNAILLEEHLREKGKVNLKKAGQPVPTVDPSEADFFDTHHDTEPERVTEAPSRQASMSARSDRNGTHRSEPAAPAPARTKSRGWFGWGNRERADDVDLEAGNGGTPSRSNTLRKERHDRAREPDSGVPSRSSTQRQQRSQRV